MFYPIMLGYGWFSLMDVYVSYGLQISTIVLNRKVVYDYLKDIKMVSSKETVPLLLFLCLVNVLCKYFCLSSFS